MDRSRTVDEAARHPDAGACFYQLSHLRQIRWRVGREVTILLSWCW